MFSACCCKDTQKSDWEPIPDKSNEPPNTVVPALALKSETPLKPETPLKSDSAGGEKQSSGNTFKVTLTRTSSRDVLGVDVNHADQKTLTVDRINETEGCLVYAWNCKVGDELRVKRSDCVIRVNGIEDNAPQMIKACKQIGDIVMEVRRGG